MKEFKRTAYSEKLRDPRWQKKRLLILERDKWACQICGDDKSTLNVHHRWYEPGQEPWDATDLQLVTLCDDCHKSESENRRSAEEHLLRVLKSRFFSGDLHTIASIFHYLPHQLPVLDEVLLTALDWYLIEPENCQRIVDGYFAHLKEIDDEETT